MNMNIIIRIDVEQNLQLKLIRIQFPDPIFTSHPIIFEDLVDLVTPWSLAAEIHILDASQRMFCAVFEHGTSGTTGIHVVLDWLKGQSFIFDTGIPYVSSAFSFNDNRADMSSGIWTIRYGPSTLRGQAASHSALRALELGRASRFLHRIHAGTFKHLEKFSRARKERATSPSLRGYIRDKMGA